MYIIKAKYTLINNVCEHFTSEVLLALCGYYYRAGRYEISAKS